MMFNAASVTCNNDLYCGNLDYSQPVNYTHFKGNNKSYIDHVFLSCYAQDHLLDCRIMSDMNDNKKHFLF